MAQKSILELAKERIIQQYGTNNCNILVKMSSSEKAFSVLKKRIEKKYLEYRDVLPEEQYHEFIEEIFEIFKEYKSSLESVDERSYGRVYGDYAVKIAEIKKKYGV